MLTQATIDAKIAELEAEEKSLLAGADAPEDRLRRVRIALRIWRQRKPTGPEIIERIERLKKFRDLVEADIQSKGDPPDQIHTAFEGLLHNISLDDPIAEETMIPCQIISVRQLMVDAKCRSDLVDALDDVMAPGIRN
jgi:hypothetical protein